MSSAKRFLSLLIVLAALAPAARLAWTWRAMPHLGVYDDDAVYWVTAKSLAEGRGYRIAGLPGEPAQTKYPPVYPLLLASIWKLNPSFPSNLPAAMLFQWLMLPALLAASWSLFAQFGLSHRLKLVLCALMALNPIQAFFSATLMSETLFTICLVSAVILGEKAARARRELPVALCAGLLAGIAYLTRSVALPMLIAGPLYLLMRRRARPALFFAAGMLPLVAGWLLWMRARVPRSLDLVSSFYTDYVRFNYYGIGADDLGLYLGANFSRLTEAIGQMLVFNPSDSFLSVSLARVLSVAAIAGAIRLARRSGHWLYALFALLYLLLLLVWPYTPDPRFVLPLLPLMLAGLAVEFLRILRVVGKAWRSQRAAAAVVSLGLAAFLAAGVWLTYSGLTGTMPRLFAMQAARTEESLGAFRWIAANVPPGDPLVAYHQALLYLYTGRQAAALKTPPVYAYRQDGPGLEAHVAEFRRAAAGRGIRRVLHLRCDDRAGWDDAAGMAMHALTADPERQLLYSDAHAVIAALP
ncbi:MAG: glycosyltransferase family 39 protein [Bryobacteraceae bacterium]|nr:glycosyltransferase family 39 protein [Bryobacteraceae bacterium]